MYVRCMYIPLLRLWLKRVWFDMMSLKIKAKLQIKSSHMKLKPIHHPPTPLTKPTPKPNSPLKALHFRALNSLKPSKGDKLCVC